MNNIRPLIITLSVIFIIFSCKKSPTNSDSVSDPVAVTFPDANFETLIREALDQPTGDIFDTDLQTINVLTGDSREISDITGIEYCDNLDTLNLSRNTITELTPIGGLVKLEELTLIGNTIADVSPISGLTNLKALSIRNNLIRVISARDMNRRERKDYDR